VALVGGGDHPKFWPNKLLLWDDREAKFVGELTFKAPIVDVIFRVAKLVVVLEEKFFIFGFPDLSLQESVDTGAGGLVAYSQDPETHVTAWPDKVKGYFRVCNFKLKQKVK